MTITLDVSKTGTRVSPDHGFRWHVLAGDPPVAFLASALAGLGAGETCPARISVTDGLDIAVTTQAASNLLRCDEPAVYSTEVEVSGGAHVSMLPWVAIPFPGARAELSTKVVVSDDSTAMWWDSWALGRIARDEFADFEELAQRNTIVHDGRVVLDETTLLRRADKDRIRAMLGGFTHYATMNIVAPAGAVDPSLVRTAIKTPRSKRVGVSEVAPGLTVIRILAHGSEAIEQALWPIVGMVRRLVGRTELSSRRIARRW